MLYKWVPEVVNVEVRFWKLLCKNNVLETFNFSKITVLRFYYFPYKLKLSYGQDTKSSKYNINSSFQKPICRI